MHTPLVNIDKTGIAWGLLLAIAATGMYDTFTSLLQGQNRDAIIYAISSGIVLVLLMVFMRNILVPVEKNSKTHPKKPNQNPNAKTSKNIAIPQDEERKLQIKMAQLNAELQISLAGIFGFLLVL